MRRFFIAASISRCGYSFSLVALMGVWQAISGTASGWGWVALVRALPFLVFGILCGYLVDRLNRRALIIGADLFRTVALFMLMYATDTTTFLLLTFLFSSPTALSEPLSRRLTVSLVARGELQHANGILESSRNLASMLGLLLAGSMLLVFSPWQCLAFNAALFVLAALINSSNDLLDSRREPQSPKILPHDALLGMRLLCSQRELWFPALMWGVLFILLGVESTLYFPLAVEKEWGTAAQVSSLLTAVGVGSFLAALVFSRCKVSATPAQVAVLMAVDALLLGVLAQQNHAAGALVIACCLGATETTVVLSAMTALQVRAPENAIGRIFSTLSFIQEPVRILVYAGAALLALRFSATGALQVIFSVEFLAAGALASLAFVHWYLASIAKARQVAYSIESSAGARVS